MWLKHGYSSLKITLDSSNESEDQSDDKDVGVVVDLDQSDDESNSGRSQDLGYLVGDITQPQHTGGGKAIIVHCLGMIYVNIVERTLQSFKCDSFCCYAKQ